MTSRMTAAKTASRVILFRLAKLRHLSQQVVVSRDLSYKSADDSNIQALRRLLKESSKDHMEEIERCASLKDAHVYCKLNALSGQLTGPLIERYMQKAFGMKKIRASECAGDLSLHNVNYELKISNGGQNNNKFNYVQLRMNHECDYILTAYYLNETNVNLMGELFVFHLNKDSLKKLVLRYGSYAHGTKRALGEISEEDLNDKQNKKEYCLRPIYGDVCWEALQAHRISDNVLKSLYKDK